jgi:hypothetical protein
LTFRAAQAEKNDNKFRKDRGAHYNSEFLMAKKLAEELAREDDDDDDDNAGDSNTADTSSSHADAHKPSATRKS